MIHDLHIFASIMLICSRVSTIKFFLSCECIAIEDLLEEAKSLPVNELPGHFDVISKKCQSLQRLVSDATLYLASFELKTAQEVCMSM